MTSSCGQSASARTYSSFVLFYLALAIPSIGAVQHSPLGNVGVIAYVLAVCPLVYYFYMRLRLDLSPRAAAVNSERLGIAVLVVIVVGYYVTLPLLFREHMSDVRPRSLDLVVGALLRGRYPYYAGYSKAEPMTILPGGLLLAVPFVVLGLTRFTSLFWLAIFYLYARNCFSRTIVYLLIVLWLCSPVLGHEMATGSDLLGDCLRVVILTLLFYRFDRLGRYLRFLVMVFAGLSLSSRLAFLPAVPLLFSVLVHRVGRRQALLHAATAAITFVLVTLPFYVYDPEGFTPLRVTRFLNDLNGVVPHYDLAVVVVVMALALVLSLRGINSVYDVLGRISVVLAFPVLVGIVMTSVHARRFEVGAYANFGLTFLFFAAIPLWYYPPIGSRDPARADGK